jgi:cytochrome c
MSRSPRIGLIAAIALMGTAGGVSAQSVEAGEKIFRQRCMTCHGLGAMADYSPGPAIAGIAGRPIGSLSNYDYTPGLKAVRGKWSAEALDAFLKSPAAFAPGTSMAQALPDGKERSDLIAYLQTLH